MALSDPVFASDDGYVLWPLVFWIRCQQHLATADALMRLAATNGSWAFVSNPRGWPGRLLRRRRGLHNEEVRVMLNPHYLEDGNVHYLLSHLHLRRFSRLPSRSEFDRDVARYSPEEVGSLNRVRADLESLTGAVWQPAAQ